jgi:hypothetical protein
MVPSLDEIEIGMFSMNGGQVSPMAADDPASGGQGA